MVGNEGRGLDEIGLISPSQRPQPLLLNSSSSKPHARPARSSPHGYASRPSVASTIPVSAASLPAFWPISRHHPTPPPTPSIANQRQDAVVRFISSAWIQTHVNQNMEHMPWSALSRGRREIGGASDLEAGGFWCQSKPQTPHSMGLSRQGGQNPRDLGESGESGHYHGIGCPGLIRVA